MICSMKCTVSAVTVTLVTLGLAAVCDGTWWPFSAGEEEETVAADKGIYTCHDYHASR